MRITYGSERASPPLLPRSLNEIGRPSVCELCRNAGDGNYHNNEATNLRYLSPNCHAQTDTFSGRSRGKYTQASVVDEGCGPQAARRPAPID